MKTNFKEQLKDERPYWKVIVSLTFSLVSTILFIYFGFRLLIFFMPFVVGWFIAYIASPVVNWLERKIRLVKKLGSALIIIGVLTAVVFLIYLAGSRLWREAAVLIQDLPEMYEELEKGLEQIGDSTKVIFEKLPAGVQS